MSSRMGGPMPDVNIDVPWLLAAVAVVAWVSALFVYSRTPGSAFVVNALLLAIVLTLVSIGTLLVSTLVTVNPDLAKFVATYNRGLLGMAGLYALVIVVERYRHRSRVARG
jgi:hypothetical protein